MRTTAARPLTTRAAPAAQEGGPSPADHGASGSWATAAVVAVATAFVLAQLEPGLLLTDTTPTGGDTGGHIWGPAFLRDHVLPHGRLVGWAPDWFAGFAWPQFYFPLPSLLVVLLDLLLPYNVAFKLVAVLGVLTLPSAAWAFGRLTGMRAPAPECLALATLPFLFDRSFMVHGGNLASTLAGEFAFSLALSAALVFLGVYARTLATGRGRATAAVLLAVVVLCHVVPAFLAVIGAVVLTALRWDRARVRRIALPVAGVAALLAAFWVVPFLARASYTVDLGYEKVAVGDILFPEHGGWVVALSFVGAVAAVRRRDDGGMCTTAVAAASLVAFALLPAGRLWNARLVPLWMIALYLLAGLGVAELGRLVGAACAWWVGARDDLRARIEGRASVATAAVATVGVLLVVALPLQVLPSWFPLRTSDTSFLPEWARSAYGGYERAESYPEYRDLIATMRRLGRTEGCGRFYSEHDYDLSRMGSSFALSAMPYWTDGCMASLTGLFKESSATTPYVMLADSALSATPLQLQRGLPYRPIDVNRGVAQLQLLGVRYYLAHSDVAKAQARANPSLRLLATSGPWTTPVDMGPRIVTWEIYAVEDADLVVPLAHEPVVVGDAEWSDAAVTWFEDPGRWEVPLVASGPDEWQRLDDPLDRPRRRSVPEAVVSNVRINEDTISFDVDRVGSPVLVKVSYFPNWRVSGGDLRRAAPNFMVVVPTARHVTLHYGTTPIDVAAHLLTVLGVVGLVLLWRPLRGRRRPPGDADATRNGGQRPQRVEG